MYQQIKWLQDYLHFTNYVSAAMLYLKENYFLLDELKQDHIKHRILGHWGTVPGINLIYGALNVFLQENNVNITLINGSGHGAPAILSGLFVEGTLESYYPELYKRNLEGLGNLIHNFSWPSGFPSHTSPMVPGTLHEGGELGYSLATAFGVAFDNPNNLIVCIVGDGETETATLSASWQSFKFLNPILDGSVLPIVHLNGYKISCPTIFGTMSNQELTNYFKGLGLHPILIDQYSSENFLEETISSIETAYNLIEKIKADFSSDENIRPKWPVIILKNKKGWTGPKKGSKHLNYENVEDNNLSHGIPLQYPKTDTEEFEILKLWLESYNFKRFIKHGELDFEFFEYLPKLSLRIGLSKLVNKPYEPLKLPSIDTESIRIMKRGERPEKRMEFVAEYLRDIILENNPINNFRIFSPDESESNALSALFAATDRIYMWPLRDHDKYFSKEGHIMEILSENVLQGWYTGYVLSGRHGVLISYEAFLNIISSQIDQHIKFLKHSQKVPWRNDVPSINLIATSVLWRQEHNGFTHQNPTLINSLLTKYFENVNIYFPVDVNTLLATLETTLSSKNGVNLIVSGKRDMPQWLFLNESIEHVKDGLSIWEWMSDDSPDIVFASCGDYQTNETIKGIQILKELLPEVKIRYININQISQFKIGNEVNILSSEKLFNEYFTKEKPILFNFHGYPTAIQQLLFGKVDENRIKILGYQENGTTTTPLDMQVLNETSRYHVALESINLLLDKHQNKEKLLKVKENVEEQIQKHKEYIIKEGRDIVSII